MFQMFKSIIMHRGIIWELAKNDIRSRYLGSILGSLWIFIMPLINLTIIWGAFQFGLKAGQVNNVPFILWLITGLFPWIFFSESVLATSNSVIEKAFMVKKIVFDVELLPFIKIVASSILFIFLSLVMILMFLGYGHFPNKYWLQIPYFMFCLFSLVLSVSWLTSSIVVFYRDLGQVVSAGLQVGFWVTPIFWSPDLLPQKLRFLIFINPVSYIVSGYRDSLISKQWFWHSPIESLCFWGLVVACHVIGIVIFRRLRPHFADVL